MAPELANRVPCRSRPRNRHVGVPERGPAPPAQSAGASHQGPRVPNPPLMGWIRNGEVLRNFLIGRVSSRLGRPRTRVSPSGGGGSGEEHRSPICWRGCWERGGNRLRGPAASPHCPRFHGSPLRSPGAVRPPRPRARHDLGRRDRRPRAVDGGPARRVLQRPRGRRREWLSGAVRPRHPGAVRLLPRPRPHEGPLRGRVERGAGRTHRQHGRTALGPLRGRRRDADRGGHRREDHSRGHQSDALRRAAPLGAGHGHARGRARSGQVDGGPARRVVPGPRDHRAHPVGRRERRHVHSTAGALRAHRDGPARPRRSLHRGRGRPRPLDGGATGRALQGARGRRGPRR